MFARRIFIPVLALAGVAAGSLAPAHAACPPNNIRVFNSETRTSDCLEAPRATKMRRSTLSEKQLLRQQQLRRRQRSRTQDAKAHQGLLESTQKTRAANQARQPRR